MLNTLFTGLPCKEGILEKLPELSKRSSTYIRDDIVDVRMVLFKTALLVGYIRVAVEDIGTALSVFRELDPFRILEFRTVVCKDNGERILEETISKAVGQGIEGFQDRLLVASLHQDNDHETVASEEEREQALTGSAAAFHGIHLNDIEIWMRLHEAFKVLIGALVPVEFKISLYVMDIVHNETELLSAMKKRCQIIEVHGEYP